MWWGRRRGARSGRGRPGAEQPQPKPEQQRQPAVVVTPPPTLPFTRLARTVCRLLHTSPPPAGLAAAEANTPALLERERLTYYYYHTTTTVTTTTYTAARLCVGSTLREREACWVLFEIEKRRRVGETERVGM